MSARRAADIGLRLAVPVLATGLLAFVLVEPQAVGVAPGQATRAPVGHVPVESAELVCPGPETVGVRDVAAETSAAGNPAAASVSAATAPAGLRPPPAGSVAATGGRLTVTAGGGRAVSSSAAAGDRSADVVASTREPWSPVVVAVGAAAPGVVAEQVTRTPDGDLRGLSSATCLAPQDDVWLVGGGTETGRRGRLVLTNPHESTVEVSVDVLTADGPAARTPGSTVAIKPHSRTVLLLDALAPQVASPVLHVRSTGGSIGAVLADAWLEGTTPRGTDDVVASLAPATRVLVPGVRIAGAATLRLAVPGSSEAVAQVRLIGPKGAVELADDGVVRVPAGASRDLDLSQVPADAYAVEVTADVPVVAGALVQRRAGGSGPGELAWSAASDPITSLAGVAGWPGDGARTELVLTAPGANAEVDVLTRGADGGTSSSTVQITGGSTKVVPVAGACVWLRPRAGSGELVGARFVTVDTPAGPLVTTGPLRQVALTRVPANLAPAAG